MRVKFRNSKMKLKMVLFAKIVYGYGLSVFS